MLKQRQLISVYCYDRFMQPEIKKEVLSKVCYHRGIGKENTLDSIQSAIVKSPFLVEFDVQWSKNELRLGHPPDLGENTLVEALKLFQNTNILPKIDLKLTNITFVNALGALVHILNQWTPRKAIINIDGDLDVDEYMQAEKELIRGTDENILLNIDLGRYGTNNNEAIVAYLKSLNRLPFSISPNLNDNAMIAIKLAKSLGIHHIHFWSFFDEKHSLEDLYNRMELCRDNDLEVFFDIKETNISENQ